MLIGEKDGVAYLDFSQSLGRTRDRKGEAAGPARRATRQRAQRYGIDERCRHITAALQQAYQRLQA